MADSMKLFYCPATSNEDEMAAAMRLLADDRITAVSNSFRVEMDIL